MTYYRIENLTSGHVFGEYEGETADAAWAAMCNEAGCIEPPTADIKFTEVKFAVTMNDAMIESVYGLGATPREARAECWDFVQECGWIGDMEILRVIPVSLEMAARIDAGEVYTDDLGI